MTAILTACRESFAVDADAEITLECNPESVTAHSLDGYRAAGANRLSFGAQSFRADELARLGRLHGVERPAEAVALARAAGFDNVSLDLMLWLPGQTPAHARESVDRLVAIGPEHASLYLLEIYPNAPLREEMARAGWSVAPDDDAADMYLDAMATLDAAGYRQYEISNVSRAGRESRHNLLYWQDGDWLAFGSGAHGARGGARWRNVAGTGEYIARVGERGDGGRRAPGARRPDPDGGGAVHGPAPGRGRRSRTHPRRYGVDVWARYGERLGPLARAGHLVHDPGARIRLTRQGMLVANEAMAVFIDRGIR